MPKLPTLCHTAETSAGKSLLGLHILESLPAHTFSRQKQMHTKSARALGIWSAQDASGLLHTPHRWQKCLQQGRDVLAEFAVHAQIVSHRNWMISHRWAIVTTPALLCWGLAGCQLPLSSCFWELLARRDGWKELPQQQRAQRTTTAVIGTSKNSQLPGFWLNSLPTGYFWRYIISQPFCCVF